MLHGRADGDEDALIQAGVLLAAEGLDPDPAQGVVVDVTGEKPVVADGPYGETKELFGGFYIIDVATLDDAVAWAQRTPLTAGTKVEIRRVTTIDEFPQDNEWIRKGTCLAAGDRAAVTVVEQDARAAVEAVWRMQAARIVGSLARFTSDFELAEDCCGTRTSGRRPARLFFVTSHPVLSAEARVALTLRTSGGLASAGVSFTVPDRRERVERLGSVLSVVYAIFTEGSSATSGDDGIRHDLAREALRLARVMVRLHPAADTYGLLALLELTAARFPAGELLVRLGRHDEARGALQHALELCASGAERSVLARKIADLPPA